MKELRGEKGYTKIEHVGIRPTFDLCGMWGGYTAEGSKTVLPSKAYAKLSCRLVPNQDHEKIAELVKDYFEKKMGRDLYEAVEKDTFRPDMRVFRCEDAEWLCSEEAYAIYAPCMYQPTYEKYKAEMEGYLADPAVRIHVCENDGIRAGMLVLKLSGIDAEILGISVSEDRRGRGIGQYMVREVMKAGQLESLYAQTDDDAVEFYRKSGFDTEKTEVQYPNGTVVRYRCTLNNPKAANREG